MVFKFDFYGRTQKWKNNNSFCWDKFLAVEFTEESNESLLTPNDGGEAESPSFSPSSTVSGPYIPISECITGKPLNTPVGMYFYYLK